jgi:hypothetical protein
MLAAAALLFGDANAARAHPIHYEYKVVPAEHKVRVETWFSNDERPKNSYLLVSRSDGGKLAEVPINDDGVAVFYYNDADDLHVELKIPGHPKPFTVPRAELEVGGGGHDAAEPFADRSRTDVSMRDVLLGVTFLMALAAFVLSVRNARRSRNVKQETLPPVTPPTGAFRR